jgi:hypothetical protein
MLERKGGNMAEAMAKAQGIYLSLSILLIQFNNVYYYYY